MRNQIERHTFNVDYTSLTYDLTYEKPTQSIMKCSKWTKWTHTRPILGKNMNFHEIFGIEASNDELNGKNRIYC